MKTITSNGEPIHSFHSQAMRVEVYADDEALGNAAAAAVAEAVLRLARTQETIRIILGSANSQISFIRALTQKHQLPWERIVLFHMDEYIGVNAEHSASFRHWMQQRVTSVVHPQGFHYLAGDAADPSAEAERYAKLLRQHPIDICCLGIGENGHLAFNDPGVADFDDSATVKLVELEEKSRLQQVGEGHFRELRDVPHQALTVTIPVLVASREVFCIVPERRKAAAVRAALLGPISTQCPASILRQVKEARLFLDLDSASELVENTSIEVLPGKQTPSPMPSLGKQMVLDNIVRQGFIPIFVNDGLDPRRLVEAAAKAGCCAIEYTCRRPDAREIIPWIKREFPHLAVMVATLVDGPKATSYLHRTRDGFLSVAEAVELGADALVSFMRFRGETYTKYGQQCVMISGVATPNEALDQIELGADLIKVTVHTTTGREFVTKTSVPTHGCIPYFVSGGLNAANLEEYIQAGVVVTAAGMDMLIDKAKVSAQDVGPVAQAAIETMLKIVATAREKHQPKLSAAIRTKSSHLLASGAWYHSRYF